MDASRQLDWRWCASVAAMSFSIYVAGCSNEKPSRATTRTLTDAERETRHKLLAPYLAELVPGKCHWNGEDCRVSKELAGKPAEEISELLALADEIHYPKHEMCYTFKKLKLLGFEAPEVEQGDFFIIIRDGKVCQAFTFEPMAEY